MSGCVEEVNLLNVLNQKNVATYKTASSGIMTNVLIYFFSGIIFIAFGILYERFLILLFPLGLLFLVGAILSYRFAKKFNWKK